VYKIAASAISCSPKIQRDTSENSTGTFFETRCSDTVSQKRCQC